MKPQSALHALMTDYQTNHVWEVKPLGTELGIHPNKVSERIYRIREFFFAAYNCQPGATALQFSLWLAEAEMEREKREQREQQKKTG
jgi:hypothetical protein